MPSFFKIGTPERLRGKEFIYRNANNLHLSDFQKLLSAHVSELVDVGTKVLVVLDTTKVPPETTPDAVVMLTSVKPLKPTAAMRADVAGPNQAKVFQYSVPFTLEGGTHARTIDKQCKRTTILEVGEPFPCMTPRQLVVKRTTRDLSPIENAIDDINLRIDSMSFELNRDKRDGADTNNLMRIVQGSVMPQVRCIDRFYCCRQSLNSLPPLHLS